RADAALAPARWPVPPAGDRLPDEGAAAEAADRESVPGSDRALQPRARGRDEEAEAGRRRQGSDAGAAGTQHALVRGAKGVGRGGWRSGRARPAREPGAAAGDGAHAEGPHAQPAAQAPEVAL